MDYFELVKHTASIFDGELRLPINRIYENDIRAEKWTYARALIIYDYRKWQLKEMGFNHFKIEDLIRVLYGNYSNVSTKSDIGINYEYAYNHHTGKQENKKWVHKSIVYFYYRDFGFFHWPPFERRLVWSCKFCNLNEMKSKISEGVMLKILRIQALKIFNVFHVIEPIIPEAKPVIIGTVWELPPDVYKYVPVYNRVGSADHYFLTDWCYE